MAPKTETRLPGATAVLGVRLAALRIPPALTVGNMGPNAVTVMSSKSMTGGAESVLNVLKATAPRERAIAGSVTLKRLARSNLALGGAPGMMMTTEYHWLGVPE